VALAEPSVGAPVDVAEPALVSVSPDMVVKVIELIVVVVVVVLEFEFEEPEPSSVHATVRADIKDRRHALRFISW